MRKFASLYDTLTVENPQGVSTQETIGLDEYLSDSGSGSSSKTASSRVKVGFLDDILDSFGIDKTAFFSKNNLVYKSGKDFWRVEDSENGPQIVRCFEPDTVIAG